MAECARVLRPGARLCVSDLAVLAALRSTQATEAPAETSTKTY
jgi:hypothetical protein